MSDASELHDLPPTIGQLVPGIIARTDAARKERYMQNAIEPVKQNDAYVPGSGTMTPMDMLNMAVERGAGIETLEKLMALQERWEANQARKAFDAAISKAKAKISPVVRNATGHNSKRYADFSAIAKAVDPILSEYGLSYRFKTTQTDRITVTCTLSHEEGHSEETTLSGPPDTTGSKNAIQAIGSTLTYLQRYSLVAALGLAAANDDDGKGSAQMPEDILTEDQVIALREKIESVGLDTQKFCAKWGIVTVADFPGRKYKEAIDSLEAYARKRANG